MKKPSWQARLANAYSKAVIRRRDWGDEQALARRARRLFGAPAPLRWLVTRGLRVRPVETEAARGEWVEVERPEPGVVMYFHGGGYVASSAASHRPITAALARLTRRRVFALDYRLAPEHRFKAHDDALDAYRWLLGQVPSAGHVAFAGDSAGGGLLLVTLLRAREAGLPPPSSAVCFSAWTDLTGESPSVRSNDGRCAMFRTENIGQFASAYLGGADPRHPHASPVFGDLGGLPPLLLQVGSTELLLDDSRRVHEAVLAARGESTLDVSGDLMHCWQMLYGFVPEAGDSLRKAAAFIRGHLPAQGAHG